MLLPRKHTFSSFLVAFFSINPRSVQRSWPTRDEKMLGFPMFSPETPDAWKMNTPYFPFVSSGVFSASIPSSPTNIEAASTSQSETSFLDKEKVWSFLSILDLCLMWDNRLFEDHLTTFSNHLGRIFVANSSTHSTSGCASQKRNWISLQRSLDCSTQLPYCMFLLIPTWPKLLMSRKLADF